MPHIKIVVCSLLAGCLGVALGMVEFPIHHVQNARLPQRLERRQGIVNETVIPIESWNPGGYYALNVSIGTPPQIQTLVLDTASSDTFVLSNTAPACAKNHSDLHSCRGGLFDADNSSSFHLIKKDGFSASYAQTSASGDLVSDAMQLGNTVINNMTFGVANNVWSQTGYSQGLLGLGYSAAETRPPGFMPFPNIVDALFHTSAIASRLYSTYLSTWAHGAGGITFGGVDTSKFVGNLTTINLQQKDSSSSVKQFIIPLTGISYNTSYGTKDVFSGLRIQEGLGWEAPITQKALLNMSSPVWTVPHVAYTEMIYWLSSEPSVNNTFDCERAENMRNFVITFNDQVNITVPVRDFFVPIYSPRDNSQVEGDANELEMYGDHEPGDEDDKKVVPYCWLAIADGGDDTKIFSLGGPVLRSAYVVYDLDNGQVSIGQAAHNGSVVSASQGPMLVKAGPTGLKEARPQPLRTRTYTDD